MHQTESYLYTLLERIRAYLDDSAIDAKFDNQFLINHIICPAQTDVIARLSHTHGAPVILRYPFTLDADLLRYRLPPCVQEVLRLMGEDEDRTSVTWDATPSGMFSVNGSVWSLEGNPGALELVTAAPPQDGATATILYISNGDIRPHYGTGTLVQTTEDGLTVHRVTLATTPTLGVLDRRVGAYNGQTLRILPSGTGPVEESLIEESTYSAGVYKAKLTRPLTYTGGGSVTYEIAPTGMQSMTEAIAVWSAMKLGTHRGVTQGRFDALRLMYLAALKTAGDNLTTIQNRTPRHYTGRTVDSKSRSDLMLGFNY
jgi:hypothetical protein